MIRTLIVDDEPYAREELAELLASDPDIEILGMAGNAIEALDHLHRPIRLQLIEPHTQGCTHDAAADQQHIDFLCLFRVNGRDPHRQSQPQQGSVYFFKHQ